MALKAPPIDGRRRANSPDEVRQAAPGSRLYIKVDVDEEAGTQLWLLVDKKSADRGDLTVWAQTDAGTRTNTETDMEVDAILAIAGTAFAALAAVNSLGEFMVEARARARDADAELPEPLTRRHLFFRGR
jgi:hypothetical protein